jgi:Mor family transcriptional regulator
MMKANRDATIFKLWLRGWTYQRIADRYNLTTHRINQIIAAQKALNEWHGSRAA